MWLVVVAIVVLVGAMIFFARYFRQVSLGDYQDAEGTERRRWIAGNGRHGGV